ncbi:MAG: hypothetical protein EBX70_09065, partial [Betaproteobacteria bacterium]|nr:hypothetical protein [Betaproteobacteria bacterium]
FPHDVAALIGMIMQPLRHALQRGLPRPEQAALFHQRAEPFVKQPQRVDDMLHEGSKRASQAAEQTMVQVREAMGLLPRWS